MKKLIFLISIILIFALSCSSLKISGMFNMADGSNFKFSDAKIKINNNKAVIKTKTGETVIDMHKVANIEIDIK